MHMTGAKNTDADESFSISSRRLEDGILVALSGEVDLMTASVIEDELRRAEQSEDLVVLDLAEVSFMDSTGLQTVISADQRLRERGATLRLIHVPGQVARLFELVGVRDHLTIDTGVDGGDSAVGGEGQGSAVGVDGRAPAVHGEGQGSAGDLDQGAAEAGT